MAWPLTPLRTFIADSVPVIDAEFLTLIQETINDLFEGVISLKSLVVDAVGGDPTSTPAGSIQVGRLVGSNAEPSANAVAKGQINVESVPTSVAHISGGFVNVLWGFGVHAVDRHPGGAAQGDYDVTFQHTPSGADVNHHSLQVTGKLGGTYDRIEVDPSLDGSNRLKCRVTFVNASADVDFYVTAHVM